MKNYLFIKRKYNLFWQRHIESAMIYESLMTNKWPSYFDISPYLSELLSSPEYSGAAGGEIGIVERELEEMLN